MTDLTYSVNSMFATFFPESKAGEDAWRVIAEQNEGVAKVLSIHLEFVLYQLRKAGYSVKKAQVKNPLMTDNELLAELGVL